MFRYNLVTAVKQTGTKQREVQAPHLQSQLTLCIVVLSQMLASNIQMQGLFIYFVIPVQQLPIFRLVHLA